MMETFLVKMGPMQSECSQAKVFHKGSVIS